MVTKKTVLEVRKRERHRCKECKILVFFDVEAAFLTQGHIRNFMERKGELHHIYYKSQYKRVDRDDSRNLVLLCPKHHRGPEGVHWGNRELDQRLKAWADHNKPPATRATETIKRKPQPQSEKAKLEARKFRRIRRQEQEEYFKKTHDGFTASQVAYRQQKQFLARKKRNGK